MTTGLECTRTCLPHIPVFSQLDVCWSNPCDHTNSIHQSAVFSALLWFIAFNVNLLQTSFWGSAIFLWYGLMSLFLTVKGNHSSYIISPVSLCQHLSTILICFLIIFTTCVSQLNHKVMGQRNRNISVRYFVHWAPMCWRTDQWLQTRLREQWLSLRSMSIHLCEVVILNIPAEYRMVWWFYDISSYRSVLNTLETSLCMSIYTWIPIFAPLY